MTLIMHSSDTSIDDIVSVFQLDGKPLRGRTVRLGSDSLGSILARHNYPTELARILAEAATLATLVGTSLKFDGRLLVQAEGDGPVSMLVAEYATNGNLRAYARFDRERWENLQRINKGDRPHMPQLFGAGALALIMVSNDSNMTPYQGVVPLTKATLAECAEVYFQQSEQVPTRVALSAAEHSFENGQPYWRAGGMLLQQIAGDDARGTTDDAWNEARALFGTISDVELVDPELSSDQLLYRLFHETGVRSDALMTVKDACTCNEDRLRGTLASMPQAELAEMADAGILSVDCQFCARHYEIPYADVTSQ